MANVFLIASSVWLAVGSFAVWVMFGALNNQKGRLAHTLGGMSTHWQLGLLLLVLLFYRTIRDVLGRIEKGPAGMTFPKAPKTQGEPDEEDALPAQDQGAK